MKKTKQTRRISQKKLEESIFQEAYISRNAADTIFKSFGLDPFDPEWERKLMKIIEG